MDDPLDRAVRRGAGSTAFANALGRESPPARGRFRDHQAPAALQNLPRVAA